MTRGNLRVLWIASVIILVVTGLMAIMAQKVGRPEGSPIFDSADSMLYWKQADQSLRGLDVPDNYAYSKTIETVIDFTGLQSPHLIRFLLAFCTIGTLWLLALAHSKGAGAVEDGSRTRSMLMVLICALPSFILYSVNALNRDALLYLLAALCCYFLVQYNKQREFRWLILIAVSGTILGIYRNYAGGCFLLAFAVNSAWEATRLKRKEKGRWLDILTATVLASGLVGALVMGGQMLMQKLSWDAIADYQGSYGGGADAGIKLVGASPAQLSYLIPYNWLSQNFGPLPNQISNASLAAIFVLEVPIILIVGCTLARNFRRLSSLERMLIFQAFVYSLVLGLMHSNLGTSTRVRIIEYEYLLLAFSLFAARHPERCVFLRWSEKLSFGIARRGGLSNA